MDETISVKISDLSMLVLAVRCGHASADEEALAEMSEAQVADYRRRAADMTGKVHDMFLELYPGISSHLPGSTIRDLIHM